MADSLDPTDRRLLDGWQRALPMVPRPFAAIAEATGLDEAEVIARLARMRDAGLLTRVGATLRPNTAGASTLAAVAAPEHRIEEVARAIGAEPGVNHSYLRENAWNLWFVVTGPERVAVDAALARIGRATGLTVLDLPLVRPFNLDLGFPLSGGGRMAPASAAPAGPIAIAAEDRAILQRLTEGLALVPRPYAALGAEIGLGEAQVLARLRRLTEGGVISRLGVILRHRALGWTANAMVVWQLDDAEAAETGPRLAAQPGVTLCYQRRPAPGLWPYTLYAMIHARSREEALATLAAAEAGAGLAGRPREILFSLRCFRQRGATVAPGPAREAIP